jgi:hypothetical protein
MAQREDRDHPQYEPQPETAAGPPREPLPIRPRPSDGPLPRYSGGGPSLTDEPPDEGSALGQDETVEGSER